MKLRSFRITVSVPGDISTSVVDKICGYLDKKMKYAYVVLENGDSGKLHLHACIVTMLPTAKGSIVGHIWKNLVKPVHTDAIRSFAVKGNAMVDHAWYDEYLQKENTKQVVLNRYERDEVTKFFPTEEEQKILMEHVLRGTNDRTNRYIKLAHEWEDAKPDGGNLLCCHHYLAKRMYGIEADLDPITDPVKMRQFVVAVWKCRYNDYAPNDSDKAYYDKVLERETLPKKRKRSETGI